MNAFLQIAGLFGTAVCLAIVLASFLTGYATTDADEPKHPQNNGDDIT